MKKSIMYTFFVLALICAALFFIAIYTQNSYLFAAGFCMIIVVALLFIAYNWFYREPILIDKEINELMSVGKNAMEKAKFHNLQTELLIFSLKNMKENPELTIKEAINNALTEWDI